MSGTSELPPILNNGYFWGTQFAAADDNAANDIGKGNTTGNNIVEYNIHTPEGIKAGKAQIYAQNGITTGKVLTEEEVFVPEKTTEEKIAATKNHDTSPDELARLSGDPNPIVRRAVAENSCVSLLEPEYQHYLVTNPDPAVRTALAANDDTPSDTLSMLAQDDNFSVRMAVAGNRNAPLDILTNMAEKETDASVLEAIVENPNPSTELTKLRIIALNKLAKSDDPHVLAFVARNPNTPRSTLITVVKKEEDKIAAQKEPAKDDLAVLKAFAENPNRKLVGVGTLLGLERQALTILAKSNDYKAFAAGHPDTPLKVLEILATDDYDNVREAVAGNANIAHISPEIRQAWAEKEDNPYVLAALAGNPNTPKDTVEILTDKEEGKLLEKLAAHEELSEADLNVLKTLVENKNTPPDKKVTFLKILAQKDNYKVFVAGNSDTPPEVLESLAKDDDDNVRIAVAKNPQIALLSPRTVQALATDEITSVRAAVAGNANIALLPAEARQALAGDKSGKVRVSLAHNSKTPPETLVIMAAKILESAAKEGLTEGDQKVLVALIVNPHTPPETRTALTKLFEEEKELLVTQKKLAESLDPETRIRLAKDHKTLPEVLEILSGDKSPMVRQTVEENPNTPPAVRAKLAEELSAQKRIVKKGDIKDRIRLAKDPGTWPEILDRLAEDEEIKVQLEVARNPNVAYMSLDVLKELAAVMGSFIGFQWVLAQNPNTPPEILDILSGGDGSARDEFLREAVAKNINTGPKTLRRLADDDDPRVRAAVAGNPKTPPEDINILAQDMNDFVRAAARGNPNYTGSAK